jgi:hypothetical protein
MSSESRLCPLTFVGVAVKNTILCSVLDLQPT